MLSLELQVKAMNEQKFEMELEISRKVSEIISLKKKYEADGEQHAKLYEKLHKNWSGQEDAQNLLTEQLTTARNELESANIRISFLS